MVVVATAPIVVLVGANLLGKLDRVHIQVKQVACESDGGIVFYARSHYVNIWRRGGPVYETHCESIHAVWFSRQQATRSVRIPMEHVLCAAHFDGGVFVIGGTATTAMRVGRTLESLTPEEEGSVLAGFECLPSAGFEPGQTHSCGLGCVKLKWEPVLSTDDQRLVAECDDHRAAVAVASPEWKWRWRWASDNWR